MPIQKDFHLLQLQINKEQAQLLKTQYGVLTAQLEKGAPVQPALFAGLKEAMREVLLAQPDFPDLQKWPESQHHTLHLTHADNFILNLPWRLALEDRERLYLTKGLPTTTQLPAYQPDNPLPLKILVMIAAPEGEGVEHALSWEREEAQIINAFEQLYENADVEIDFTPDGSLESLEKKLAENHYHILHFSGHGVYRDGKGYLALEDPASMQQHLCEADGFAMSINKKPEHRPAVVLLSSCQTAQGSTQEGFRGVTNQLLAAGVPAVIAMGFSILDTYATHFAATFYQQLADKEPVERAFYSGIRFIRALESQRLQNQPLQPGQWMIPQLYLTEDVSALVEWKAKQQKLKFKSIKLVTGTDRLLLGERKDYQFLGRRRERKELFALLREKMPVLIKGQGGVGKTSMAEHLVERLIARDGRTQPFAFNENTTGIEVILKTLQDFFLKERGNFTIATKVKNHSDAALEQLQFLLAMLYQDEHCAPIFIFDNLENFQNGKGGAPFKEEHSDLLEAIRLLENSGAFPLLLTCRYPLHEFPDIKGKDLNQVPFTDFYKKCQQLSLRQLQWQLKTAPKATAGKNAAPGQSGQPVTFQAVVQLLHESIGGNYRALEFFDKLYREKKDGIYQTLERLDDFRSEVEKDKTEVLADRSRDLVFKELLDLLTPDELDTMLLLTRFRVPVLTLALDRQRPDRQFAAPLRRLLDLTLTEQHQKHGSQQDWHYVTAIVRDLLAEHGVAPVAFDEGKAGGYFEYIVEEGMGKVADLEEAFHHYVQGGLMEQVHETGRQLCQFYYDAQLFRNALFYGEAVEALLGEGTHVNILNHLGLIYQLFGHLDIALGYYEKSLKDQLNKGNRQGEGAILNNIGQIHKAKGDYETALEYLGQSLKIRQEIGDRQGEGTTLNNLATTAYAKGDYETALEYLGQSLKITQEIGDRKVESTTLGNIGQIHKAKGDYEKALQYMIAGLKICQEIGNRQGEGITLNNISQIHNAKGDYETALEYLGQSLKITQEVGDRKQEGTVLNNLATTAYAKGDYETALEYLGQSLKIRQEIGDRQGEGVTLNNIGQIHKAKGDYETALEYYGQSLIITQEIGDRKGEGTTLSNIGLIHQAIGDYETALEYLGQSLKITQEIGDRKQEAYTLHNMATIYHKNGNMEAYFQHDTLSYQTLLEIGDAHGVIFGGEYLGFRLCEAGHPEKGLPLLRRSYDMALRSGLTDAGRIKGRIDRFS